MRPEINAGVPRRLVMSYCRPLAFKLFSKQAEASVHSDKENSYKKRKKIHSQGDSHSIKAPLKMRPEPQLGKIILKDSLCTHNSIFSRKLSGGSAGIRMDYLLKEAFQKSQLS